MATAELRTSAFLKVKAMFFGIFFCEKKVWILTINNGDAPDFCVLNGQTSQVGHRSMFCF